MACVVRGGMDDIMTWLLGGGMDDIRALLLGGSMDARLPCVLGGGMDDIMALLLGGGMDARLPCVLGGGVDARGVDDVDGREVYVMGGKLLNDLGDVTVLAMSGREVDRGVDEQLSVRLDGM